MSNNPHLLKRYSLFAMFCLSYFPLFILITIKVLTGNMDYLNYGGLNKIAIVTFLKEFGFVAVLIFLSIFAFVGTAITFKNIKTKKNNAFPISLKSIKLKNEEALSYLATYVIPLLIKEDIGIFEYATFIILFIIYYKLYSTSSLILINPILNMKYGLYEIDYNHGNGDTKTALIISEHQQLEENDKLKILKLSHRLYFAF
jgi:hypothetical protein